MIMVMSHEQLRFKATQIVRRLIFGIPAGQGVLGQAAVAVSEFFHFAIPSKELTGLFRAIRLVLGPPPHETHHPPPRIRGAGPGVNDGARVLKNLQKPFDRALAPPDGPSQKLAQQNGRSLVFPMH